MLVVACGVPAKKMDRSSQGAKNLSITTTPIIRIPVDLFLCVVSALALEAATIERVRVGLLSRH
jgi:hypothetical protein